VRCTDRLGGGANSSIIDRLVVIGTVTNCDLHKILHKLEKSVIHPISQLKRMIGKVAILLEP
jgi:hypothetical protein